MTPPTFAEIARKRQIVACECGCHGFAEDRHHCLFPNLKRFPMLDVEENIVLVTHRENAELRKFDNLKWRKKFWLHQCQRYGKKHMQAWLESLPAKLDNRKDFTNG